MATKKAGGSSKNGRDSKGRRLGQPTSVFLSSFKSKTFLNDDKTPRTIFFS